MSSRVDFPTIASASRFFSSPLILDSQHRDFSVSSAYRNLTIAAPGGEGEELGSYAPPSNDQQAKEAPSFSLSAAHTPSRRGEMTYLHFEC